MTTEAEAKRALAHAGDRLFKEHLNLASAAVQRDADGDKEDYYIALGLIEEEFPPGAKLTPEHAEMFGDFAPATSPDSLPVPDEMGYFGDAPDHVECRKTVSGPLKAQYLTQRVRPAVGGVSSGNARYMDAGTLGARVELSGRVCIISNWHVFYGPEGQNGDPILQPGRSDGGKYPDDAIATNVLGVLDQYRDYAIAEVPLALQNQVAAGTYCFGQVGASTEAFVDMEVKKCGRTTDATFGRVTSTYAIARIDYPWGSRVFHDQIKLTAMAAPGDSGSLLLTANGNSVVGMVFGGSPSETYANKAKYFVDPFQNDGFEAADF